MPPARPRARRRQLSSTPGPSSSSSPTSTRTSSTAGSTSPTLSSSSASSSSPVSSSTSTLYTTSAVSSSSATPTPTTRSRPALTQVISSALQNAVTRKPELNPSHLPVPPLANAPTLSLPLTLTRPATRPNPPKPTQHVSTKTGLGAPPVHLQPPRPTETEDAPESSTTTSSSSSSSSSSSASAINLLPPPTSHIAPGQPDPSPPAPTVSTGSVAPAPTVDDTETGSFQEPTGQAVTAPSSTKHAATTIAVPVAVSALVVLAVLGALLLLRRRRRRRQPHHPYMQQVPPMTPANDSFGTVTTRSTGLGGERGMMPNPFADAESLDERSQSPAASLYRDHDDEYASPFSDSYAAAAHHAAALEASRFAAPRLSSTPRSEAPRFVFSASDSDASVVGDAGHSTPHLVVTSFAPSGTPPPPLPQLHIPPGRARNSLLIDIDPPSTSPR